MRKVMLDVEKFNERARKCNLRVDVVNYIVEKYEDKEFYIDDTEFIEPINGKKYKIYNLEGFAISEEELIWLD